MKRILFIEDDDLIIQPISLRLHDLGYETTVCKNGREGLELAQKEHPDLVLLDIVLPEMDGRLVLKNLRADKWGAEVPVIVLTNLDSISPDELPGVKTSLLKASSKLEEVIEKIQQALV